MIVDMELLKKSIQVIMGCEYVVDSDYSDTYNLSFHALVSITGAINGYCNIYIEGSKVKCLV